MCKRREKIVAFYIKCQIMKTGQLSQGRNVLKVTQSSVIHHKRNVILKVEVCDFYFFINVFINYICSPFLFHIY